MEKQSTYMKKSKMKLKTTGTHTIYSKGNFFSLITYICEKLNLYFDIEGYQMHFLDNNDLIIASFYMNSSWECYNFDSIFFIEIKDQNYVDFLLDFYNFLRK